MLDKETKRLIGAASTLGGKGLPVVLSAACLTRLCARIAEDLGLYDLSFRITGGATPPATYYSTTPAWFEAPCELDFERAFSECRELIDDFVTYFRCLCELHKRRQKYSLILSRQAFAEIGQIAPRVLLEYGNQAPDVLAQWLIWRKWMYDIDNRAAQETGYLLEPILASAIGGMAYAASKSPVTRDGEGKKGRQTDCVVRDVAAGVSRAYEFKLRVTIAASGQGRFDEELSFPADCRASEYTPVLIVLDPTPNDRLAALVKAFKENGGDAYLGEEAWSHLEREAGATMSIFLERYVREPLSKTQENEPRLTELMLRVEGETLRLVTAGNELVIDRHGPKIAVESDADDLDDPTSSFDASMIE